MGIGARKRKQVLSSTLGPQPGPQGPLPGPKGDRDCSPKVIPQVCLGGLCVCGLCCVCTPCYRWTCLFDVCVPPAVYLHHLDVFKGRAQHVLTPPTTLGCEERAADLQDRACSQLQVSEHKRTPHCTLPVRRVCVYALYVCTRAQGQAHSAVSACAHIPWAEA